MASALGNPNDKRRINMITRHVMKTKATPAGAVKSWLDNRHKPKKSRPKWMQRGDGKAAMAHIASGRAGKQSKAEKAAYRLMRAEVAREFQRQDPKGYRSGSYTTKKGKKKRGKSYASRALGSHASRYRRVTLKTPAKSKVYGVEREYLVLEQPPFLAGRPGKRKKSSAKRAATRARPAKKTTRRRKKKVAKANGLFSRRNPSLVPLGDLALANPRKNPKVMGVKNYFVGYAIPVSLAGAAAGGIHALASTSGLTAKLGDLVDKVPGVGPVVADHLPFTLQGLVVGSAFGLLAPMVGGTAGKYIALAGGAALVFGGGIDAFNYAIGSQEAAEDEAFEDELDIDLAADMDSMLAEEGMGSLALGDLAFTNGLGDIALDNMGDLAFTNGLGDGMAYETAPIGAAPGSDYGQASLADAHYSGADFSPSEGQALLNGPGAWLKRFGHAPVRHAGRVQAGPSHLAGREGHRWGWLVRMIGWQRAQKIAAMPPKRRVQFLRRLRQAAIASFNKLTLEARALAAEHQQQVDSDLVPQSVAGTVAGGPVGPGMQQNYLGDPALFMGA